MRENKKLYVDPNTAPVVKTMFSLCSNGFGPSQIAKKLTAEQILTPNAYAYQRTQQEHFAKFMETPYQWNPRTVSGVLENQVYVGDTVNCKTYTNSYKDTKTRTTPPEKLLIFPNTHEAIIDRETFAIVQKIRAGVDRYVWESRTNSRA